MSGSLNESDNFAFNSEGAQARKSRDISQQPIQVSSPSQLKSPTLNSSFLSKVNQEHTLSPLQQKKKFLRFNFGYNWNNEQGTLNNSSSQVIRSDQTKSKKWFNQFFPISQKDIKLEKQIYKQLIIKKFLSNLTQRIYSIHSKYYSKLISQLIQEQYVKYMDSGNDNNLTQFSQSYRRYFQWNLIVTIFLTLSFITLPLQISFKLEQLELLHIFVLVIFLIDILLEPIKPLLSDDCFITNKWKIAQNYISNFLLFDIAKIILFISILEVQSNVIASILFQITYILLSYSKQSHYLNEIYSILRQHIIFQYFIIISYFFIVSHIIACIWHQIGIENEDNSWLNEYINKDDTTRYLLSLQWSIQNMLMINQSYILQNKLEILVSILINIISIFNVAILIKFFYQQAIQFQKISKNNQKILNDLNHFLSYHEVPIQLRIRIQKFLEKYFKNQSESESQTKNSFINLLPNVLKDELIYEQRMKEIRICKSLKRFSQDILKKTTQIMELLTFQPQQNIIEQNENKDHSLYIIQSGIIQIYNQNSNQIYKCLRKHDSFGEWSFFTNQQRMASAKSFGFSKVYKIDAIKFQEIIQKSQIDKELYHLIKHQMLFSEQLQYANLKCYGCQSNNHLIKNCPKLNYKPNLEKLILMDNVNKQERKIFLRINFERKRLTSRTFYNIPIIIQSLKYFREKNQLLSEQDYSEEEVISSQTITDQYEDIPECTLDSLIDQQKLAVVPIQTKILNEIEYDQESSQPKKKQSSHDNQQFFLKLLAPENQESINRSNSIPKITFPNDPNQYNQGMLKSQFSYSKSTSIRMEQGMDNDQKTQDLQLIKQNKNHERDSEKKKKGEAISENLKKKLSQIQEESNINSLNLSYSEAQSYSPQHQTRTCQQKSPKLLKMTSGISSIARLKSHTQKMSQQSCQLLPEGIDQFRSKSILNINHLSMLELSFEKEEDFEIKQNYQLFFPYFNYHTVIIRYNKYIEKCINIQDRFKYSLYYRNKLRFMFVKRIQ